MDKKQEINLFNLRKLSGGKNYFELPKEEQLKICQKIVEQLKSTLPNSLKQSKKTQKDL